MLSQRKRQRTVEDFNQFCTFVLAYAAKEGWWRNDGESGDGSTPHGANGAWAYLASPRPDDGPSQPKRARQETGKRRKSDSKTSQREKKPRPKGHSGSGKESPKTKKAFPSPTLNQGLPENRGESVKPSEIRANGERHAPSGALFDERCGDGADARELTGPGEEKSDTSLSPARGSGREEVREEPVDLTIGGLIENLLKAKSDPQGGGAGRVGAERREVESERCEEESVAAGSDGRAGTTPDVLRSLVMDKRLKGLSYDQETGYQTDMEGGSDMEQDPLSSAVGRGNMSADHSRIEEDDSWDLITCFCLKPFAGRPMIECSECTTWVHLSCAKIRRTHVPEVFICQPCRDSKQNIRRSNRPRIPPRKRFSD